jgi:hypothetical protein
MRKSRVLLAGVAVAAAGVATSAFTASNTVPDSVAGFGEGAVTGITVTNIHYVQGTDKSHVDAVVFSTGTEVVAPAEATMTLKDDNGDVVGTTYDCDLGAYALGTMDITCDTTVGGPRLFSEFETVGLSVIQ